MTTACANSPFTPCAARDSGSAWRARYLETALSVTPGSYSEAGSRKPEAGERKSERSVQRRADRQLRDDLRLGLENLLEPGRDLRLGEVPARQIDVELLMADLRARELAVEVLEPGRLVGDPGGDQAEALAAPRLRDGRGQEPVEEVG